MSVAVIGVGRSLRGDDAAGLSAVRHWQQAYAATALRSDVQVAFVEEPGLELLDLLAEQDAAVLVDAVLSGAAPGTVHRASDASLSDLGDTLSSAHAWGVAEVLQLQRSLNLAPKSRTIRVVAVEAQQVEFGAGLSLAVERALPEASAAIESEVTGLLRH